MVFSPSVNECLLSTFFFFESQGIWQMLSFLAETCIVAAAQTLFVQNMLLFYFGNKSYNMWSLILAVLWTGKRNDMKFASDVCYTVTLPSSYSYHMDKLHITGGKLADFAIDQRGQTSNFCHSWSPSPFTRALGFTHWT